MRINHLLVAATVAFSLLVLPAHASTPQDSRGLSDTIRCASLFYLLASRLYEDDAPEKEEAIARAMEWFNRAKEQNSLADSRLPENDLKTTEGLLATEMFIMAERYGYEYSSSEEYIRAIRRELTACRI
jgi:hypothetical protein